MSNRSLPTFLYKKQFTCAFKSYLRIKIILMVCQKTFREMLTVTMTEFFILFDNEYYRQHHGVAIGSPLRPTIGNIFFEVYP